MKKATKSGSIASVASKRLRDISREPGTVAPVPPRSARAVAPRHFLKRVDLMSVESIRRSLTQICRALAAGRLTEGQGRLLADMCETARRSLPGQAPPPAQPWTLAPWAAGPAPAQVPVEPEPAPARSPTPREAWEATVAEMQRESSP